MGTPVEGTWPATLNRWLNVNSLVPIHRVGKYVTVPVFGPLDCNWQGYSQRLAVIPFVAPNRFILRAFALPPLNCVLCVAYINKDGQKVRYKLDNNVGEVFYFDCPLYNEQVIEKNFELEVWDTEFSDGAAENPVAVSLTTSVVGNMDSRYGDDQELCQPGQSVSALWQQLVDGNFALPFVFNSEYVANVVPPNAMLGPDGQPVLDAEGKYILL